MIPDKIKVAGIEYTVTEKETIIVNGMTNYAGACDYKECEIELDARMSDARKEQVFIHELTHAIFYEAGYVGDHEEDVERISLVLHQVLRDNPNILKSMD